MNVMMRVFVYSVVFLFLALVFVPGPASVCAQESKIAESACDDDYFNSLEARAWLEAQREITQNQNLIYKPDSVLSYTCFNQFGRILANLNNYGSQGMFSETDRWGGNVIPNRGSSLDSALGALVAPALQRYLTVNFNHDYMGGRSDLSSYKEATMTGSSSYNCDKMNRVWQDAKCYDFQRNDRKHDGFFTFKEYSSDSDKRELPSRCTNPGIWNQKMQQAGLMEHASGATWPFDKMETYFDRFDPTKGCSSNEPLPTGLVVVSNEESDGIPEEYKEKVCIMPGCYYKPNSMDGGECTNGGGASSPGP